MLFIETLLRKNNQILNLKNHIKRIKRTHDYMKWHFEQSKWENIFKFLSNGKDARIRISYNAFKTYFEEFELKKRTFKKFKTVEIDFNYHLKYKNRKNFENLKNEYKNFDELILVKNRLITDTTISNLAFFDGKEWLTPKYPLLEGTKLAEIEKKYNLKRTNIHISDLKYFKKIALINAILGFFVINEYDIIMQNHIKDIL
jgi:4-amino-4-deoxychorismate lyase